MNANTIPMTFRINGRNEIRKIYPYHKWKILSETSDFIKYRVGKNFNKVFSEYCNKFPKIKNGANTRNMFLSFFDGKCPDYTIDKHDNIVKNYNPIKNKSRIIESDIKVIEVYYDVDFENMPYIVRQAFIETFGENFFFNKLISGKLLEKDYLSMEFKTFEKFGKYIYNNLKYFNAIAKSKFSKNVYAHYKEYIERKEYFDIAKLFIDLYISKTKKYTCVEIERNSKEHRKYIAESKRQNIRNRKERKNQRKENSEYAEYIMYKRKFEDKNNISLE